ncbi:MAG: sugar ABC transporter ATP-binding protein [Gemmatimonadota bacterium]|nr:MAG: sugar ABC transporter ATP-binding protein [Gemmatimonadota bacterium]
MTTSPLVTMRGIRKSFGPVEVLHGVDFTVEAGEVHVLAGENGAGKSTLINVLCGVFDDFAGELQVFGRPERFAGPLDAARAGIATIHQELSLVPSMSVSDNLFLGRETTGQYGTVDFSFQESEAARVLSEMGLEIAPGRLVEELPIASQQLLEIARALARDARVIIFDEPTSALSEHEVEFLFGRIRELRSRGRGIVYITHKMEEIYLLADRITVLRDGRLVGSATREELPPSELVRWMVGRELAEEQAADRTLSDDPALEVSDLRVAHPELWDRFLVDGVSFTLRSGEIVGLAGLQGSGTSDLLHALFGALGGRVSGDVRLHGQPFEIKDPLDSVEHGLVLLTNDRKALGLAPEMEVVHNASLASLVRFCGFLGWVRREQEHDAVEHLTREFNLSAPSLHAPVRTLSGGNQQKVYLARCLLTEPSVLLLDEPTRGVDVGAKADIYRLMRDWVAHGISILLITSEMEELLLLSDRILVMYRGRIAAEFDRAEASKDGVLAAAMGHANTGAPGEAT